MQNPSPQRRDTYSRLKQAIYLGELSPGQRLVERHLAKQFGVSRIPLRESLVRLECEGLVRSVPHSASFVEEMDEQDAHEIWSMRLLIEPMAARLVAESADPHLFSRLHNLCVQMREECEVGDPKKVALIDIEFHHEIVAGCGHKLLWRSYQNCHIPIFRFRFSTTLETIATVPGEHLEYLDVLRLGDAATAEAHAYDHVDIKFQTWKSQVVGNNSQAGAPTRDSSPGTNAHC